MNYFSVKKINNNKNIIILSVGSYKVRAMICSFSFSNVKILGYGEKRQSRLDIINNEINNLHGLTLTIEQAIKKAELEAGELVSDVIVNPFFSNIFYFSKSISFKNKDNIKKIEKEDIFKIINNIEDISLRSSLKEINNQYGLSVEELELIMSNILSLSIDGQQVDNLLGLNGEDIRVNILNAFILKDNYEEIKGILSFLGKNIINIIPEEYAITKIGNKNNSEVFIDMGSSTTGLAIKLKDGSLKGAIKLDVGIDDLVKEISEKDSRSRGEIIKKLSRDDLFRDEKNNFLLLFLDILVEGLKEILSGDICPNDFILLGGGASNDFLKEFLSNQDFNSLGIKMLKKVNFIPASIDEIKKIIGVEKILNISNTNIIALAVAYRKIFLSENDLMQRALNNSINKKFLKN